MEYKRYRELTQGSDFLAELTLTKLDESNQCIEADAADYDFDVEVYVENFHAATKLKATKRGTATENCEVVDGKVNVFFDAPNFCRGRLKVDLTVYYPDDRFEDNDYKVTSSVPINIVVV